MSTYLRQRITEREAHIADLKRQIELASAELRAYEDALEHIGDGALKTPRLEAEGTTANSGARSRRPPPPAPPSHWPAILATLGRRSDQFTIDDVVAELAILRKSTTRKSVRAKLTDLVKDKKVIRLSDGVFTVPRRSDVEARRAAGGDQSSVSVS